MSHVVVPRESFPVVPSDAATSTRVRMMRLLVAAFVVGVLCRVLTLAAVEHHVDRGDAGAYHLSAVNILTHGVYSVATEPPYVPTIYRPPLYAAAVAAVYGVFGVRPSAVQGVQIVLSALMACLFGLAVSRLSERAGIFSMWACALWPVDMLYTGALLSEMLCATLLTVALASAVFLRGPARGIAVGIAVGALVLTRDTYLLLPLVMVGLAAVYAWRRRDGIPVLRHAVVALVVAAAVIAPWTARNYALTGRVIPVSEGRLGIALWVGGWATNDTFSRGHRPGGRVWPPEAFRSAVERLRLTVVTADTPEATRALDRAYLDAFFARLRAEPLHVVARWIGRAPLLWTGTRTEIFVLRPEWAPRNSTRWLAAKGLALGLNSAVLLTGAIGLLLAWRRRSVLLWLAVPLAYTALVHFPLHSFESRYSQPVFMFLFPFAALALGRARSLMARRAA